MYHPLPNACSTHHLLDTPLCTLPAVHTLTLTHTLPAIYIAHKVYTTCCTHHPPPPLPDTCMCTHAVCCTIPVCTHSLSGTALLYTPHHTLHCFTHSTQGPAPHSEHIICQIHNKTNTAACTQSPGSQAPWTRQKQLTPVPQPLPRALRPFQNLPSHQRWAHTSGLL